MNKQTGIGILPLAFTWIMSVGLNNHVLVLPFILHSSGRDSWISVLIGMGLALIWSPLLYYILKSAKGYHLKDWLVQACGKAGAWIILAIILLGQFAVVFSTYEDTVRWTDSSYLLETPQFIITIAILPLCYFAAQGGIETIAICAGLFFPFVALLGIFVMAVNFQFKDYTLLFPLFVDGYAPVWKGAVYAGVGYAELLMLLFIQHHVKKPIRYLHVFLLLMMITWITTGPISGSISAFGAVEASIQRYPAFEQWKLARIGSYIEHMDFFSIFQWLSGAFIRISLGLYLMIELLKVKSVVGKNIALLAVSVVMMLVVIIPKSDMMFDAMLYNYLFPGYLILMFSLSLVLGGLAVRMNRKGRRAPS
ncbi:GerAB/ArcD/ProY family transporter [Paenibacillus koleovorans]|uniref:GerAB/ArcD/ProY family transporter n=1 Tax=Paenibacillus koleovorans TaxID=121608 RepID=UPI0013E2F5C9|nr:endospore germination permease [Paenibacillus koleovorans]